MADIATKIQDFHNINDDIKLKKELKKKDFLVDYIINLRSRVEELESYNIIAKRVQMLERSQQYNRRESIELAGIPTSVPDEDLGQTSLSILSQIGVEEINSWQIHACHRLKNKKNTIIRFTTRKWADLTIHNRNK